MFRRVSYLYMVATVILSWGLLINVAVSADKSEGGEPGPDAIPLIVNREIRNYLEVPLLKPQPTENSKSLAALKPFKATVSATKAAVKPAK